MDTEELIRQSRWWREAQEMPDRHYEESAGVSVADHLERVRANLHLILSSDGLGGYFAELREALWDIGLDPGATEELLGPVALLHDIGKTRENKEAVGVHPLTKKAVKMRHPVVSLMAALEILPEVQQRRDTMLALIEKHATPYGWYMQFLKSGQVPKRKSWARLDRRIDAREDGTGLVLLCVFKLADIVGHETVEDVTWFITRAYDNYLREKGKWIPAPDQETIQLLVRRLANTGCPFKCYELLLRCRLSAMGEGLATEPLRLGQETFGDRQAGPAGWGRCLGAAAEFEAVGR